MPAPKHSPWGHVQHSTRLCDGVYHVITASHGGIYVEPQLLAAIPKPLQSTPYSSGGFFEEDCDWCIPFVVLEKRILKGGNPNAVKTIREGTHIKTFRTGYHADRRAAFESMAGQPV